MRIPVSIDLDDLAEGFVMECTNEQTLAFLLAVDKEHADAGFTEKLILELVKSLRGDLAQCDRKELAISVCSALGVFP
jgi:hypothetical protein